MVTSYDWESDTFTQHTENGARQAWRAAVDEIADKAKATLPDCAGRVDRAVAICLNHDVELLEDGQAKVASQSNGKVVYHVVNGGCECRDYRDGKAPAGWCKHRIASGLYRRATALVQRQRTGASNGHGAQEAAPVQAEAPVQDPAPVAAPATPLPEAPVSITLKATLHGHEVLVTLRGHDLASVQVQVEHAAAWLTAQAPAPAPTPAESTPQCPTHGALKPSTKGKGWYCPHKLADGSWCKGK